MPGIFDKNPINFVNLKIWHSISFRTIGKLRQNGSSELILDKNHINAAIQFVPTENFPSKIQMKLNLCASTHIWECEM